MSAEEQEWSHFIESDEIGTKPIKLTISPKAENMKALCNRLNMHSIQCLSADLILERNKVSKIICINGKINAELEQFCIITTDPVPESISDEFEAWFADPTQAVSFTKAKRERMSLKEQSDQPILEESDDPEPVIDGKIDLGELVTQHLSLALNPYPRAEGAEYALQEKTLEGGYDYDNPFAKLKDWKSKN